MGATCNTVSWCMARDHHHRDWVHQRWFTRNCGAWRSTKSTFNQSFWNPPGEGANARSILKSHRVWNIQHFDTHQIQSYFYLHSVTVVTSVWLAALITPDRSPHLASRLANASCAGDGTWWNQRWVKHDQYALPRSPDTRGYTRKIMQNPLRQCWIQRHTLQNCRVKCFGEWITSSIQINVFKLFVHWPVSNPNVASKSRRPIQLVREIMLESGSMCPLWLTCWKITNTQKKHNKLPIFLLILHVEHDWRLSNMSSPNVHLPLH